MSTSISSFIDVEFNVFSMSLPCFLLYAFFALLMLALIRLLGPMAITGYTLESSYDDSTGPVNVAYRIIAPIVWDYFFLCLAAICMTLLRIELFLPVRWVPIALYWLFVLFAKVSVRRMNIPLWAFILEAMFSIAIAVYFDWSVVSQLPELGLIAIDQSNIGFQIVAALFFAVIQIIMSATIRRNYRVYYVAPYNAYHTYPSYSSYSLRSLPNEKSLYEYRRRFGALLPERFNDDLLLRAVFYSIMFIEDTNRPKPARILENFLARANIARTTGIMQQKSEHPLSDEDSVMLAIPYVEDMWNRYLRFYAQSRDGLINPGQITFSDSAYSYEYEELNDLLSHNFSYLYGDYCGTRTLNANIVFECVRDFFQKENYGFIPVRIMASAQLFPKESECIPGEVLFWSESQTVSVSPQRTALTKIARENTIAHSHLVKMLARMRSAGIVPVSITFGPAEYLSLDFAETEDELSVFLNSGWKVYSLEID